MARMHVHVTVAELERNLAFYSAMFGCAPSVVKADYAKWELADPAVNFAISTRGLHPGVDHLGIQADTDDELGAVRGRLETAGIAGMQQQGATCCYARSDKFWSVDPQGIPWEAFHSLGSAPIYGEERRESPDAKACCAPEPLLPGSCC